MSGFIYKVHAKKAKKIWNKTLDLVWGWNRLQFQVYTGKTENYTGEVQA